MSVGRADYFGHIPNLAARVSSLAAPGQILVECSPGFGDKVSWLEEGKLGLISFESSRDESSVGNALGAIQLQELGQYYLKGFDDNLKLIYQVLTQLFAVLLTSKPVHIDASTWEHGS